MFNPHRPTLRNATTSSQDHDRPRGDIARPRSTSQQPHEVVAILQGHDQPYGEFERPSQLYETCGHGTDTY